MKYFYYSAQLNNEAYHGVFSSKPDKSKILKILVDLKKVYKLPTLPYLMTVVEISEDEHKEFIKETT